MYYFYFILFLQLITFSICAQNITIDFKASEFKSGVLPLYPAIITENAYVLDNINYAFQNETKTFAPSQSCKFVPMNILFLNNWIPISGLENSIQVPFNNGKINFSSTLNLNIKSFSKNPLDQNKCECKILDINCNAVLSTSFNINANVEPYQFHPITIVNQQGYGIKLSLKFSSPSPRIPVCKNASGNESDFFCANDSIKIIGKGAFKGAIGYYFYLDGVKLNAAPQWSINYIVQNNSQSQETKTLVTRAVYPNNNISPSSTPLKIFVNPTAPLIQNVSINQPPCFYSSDATVTINAIGGTGKYLFSLKNEFGDMFTDTSGFFDMMPEGKWEGVVENILSNGTLTCPSYFSGEIIRPDTIKINNIQKSIYHQQYNVSCFGEKDGSVNIMANGGTGVLHYNLLENFQSNTSGNFSQLSSGIYHMSIIDSNQCFIVDSFYLNEIPKYVPQYTLSNYNGYQVSCPDKSDGFFEVNNLNSIFHNCKILSNKDTIYTSIVNQLDTGHYYLQYVDQFNCSYFDTLLFTAPDWYRLEVNNAHPAICNLSNTGWVEFRWQNFSLHTSTKIIYENKILYDANYEFFITGPFKPGKIIIESKNINQCLYVDTATITFQDTMNIETNIIPETCKWTNDGKIKIKSQSNKPIMGTYLNTVQIAFTQLDSIANLSPGNYNLTMNTMEGCIYSKDFTIISANDSLQFDSLKITQPTCSLSNNGRIDFTVKGGKEPYLYMVNNTFYPNSNLHSLQNGIYTIQVRDSLNCVKSKSIHINAPEALIVQTYIQNPVCFGDTNGKIVLNISGGVGKYSVNLNGIPKCVDCSTIDSIAEGDYLLDVSDANHCRIKDTVRVSNPPPILFNPIVNNTKNCNSNDGTILLNISGAKNPSQIFINHIPQTSDSLYNIGSGVHHLLIEDSIGCISDTILIVNDSLTFSPPQLDITHPLCFNENTGKIIWKNPVDSVDVFFLNKYLQPIYGDSLSCGLYFIKFTNTSNQCHYYRSANITSPPKIITNSQVKHHVCKDYCSGKIIMNPSGGNGSIRVYLDGDSLFNHFQTYCPDKYYFRLRDQNNCKLDTTIIIHNNFNPLSFLRDTVHFCKNQPLEIDFPKHISLIADTTHSYWFDSKKIYFNQTEDIVLTYKDSLHCINRDTTFVNQVPFSIYADFLVDSNPDSTSSVHLINLSNLGEDYSSWEFIPNQVFNSDKNGNIHFVPKSSDTISACHIVDANKCKAKLCKSILPGFDFDTGNAYFFKDICSEIWPNPIPFQDILKIKINNSTILIDFQLYDYSGKLIRKGILNSEIDLSDINSGVYKLFLQYLGKNCNFTVIKN